METKKVRMGVIGAGWFVSRRHLPVMVRHPEVEVAALCRRNPEALRRMAEHFGVSRVYTDYREMLEKEPLDAVLIATPHALHYEQTKVALEQGLHVLVEKPMTVTCREGRELVALAKERGLVLEVALNPPFWAHCHRMREWMGSEDFGELEAVEILWSVASISGRTAFGRKPLPATLPGVVPPTDFRFHVELSGGGNLLDGGSHLISALLWTTGRRVVEVMAFMDEVPLDTRASVLLRLDNGALAGIHHVANTAMEERKRVREVYMGSGATLTVEGQPFRLRWEPREGEERQETEADWPPAPQPVENFVDVILGRAENLSPPEHGLAVVEVIEAAYESARTGKAVPLKQEGV